MMQMIFGTGRKQIFVRTERPVYHGGDVVSGEVLLYTTEPLQVSNVVVKIKGLEFAKFEQSIQYTENNQVRTRREVFVQKKNFFRNKFYVAGPNVFMPGSYVFPFSFALMPNLPGSIQIAGSNAGLPYFGSVRYKVKATVDLQGFFARDLKYTHDLIIHEPLHYQIASVWNEKSGTARFLCCIPKGMTKMAVQFEKNAFAPGEAVQIQMQIDNSACQVNIDKVVLKLMRRVVLQGGGRSISDVDTIARNQVPGIAAGGKDVRAIALQLPPQTHPSTEGSGLVRCEYWLDVELSLPWAPDVEIHQPVQVFAPVPPNYGAVQLPSNWQPQNYPMTQAQLLPY